MEKNTNPRNIVVFIGPTLESEIISIEDITNLTILPPIKRGDIDLLLDEKVSDTIVIVDGYFHSQPSVGHAEILRAIKTGCDVWGISSMGAIRAHEMYDLGMKGYGRVFQYFRENHDFTDDEVSLLHASEYPFKPISEPLVNIRHFLSILVSEQKLTESRCNKIITHFKDKYFGDRYLSDLFEILTDTIPAQDLLDYKKNFNKYRIKRIDCINFFRLKSWLN